MTNIPIVENRNSFDLFEIKINAPQRGKKIIKLTTEQRRIINTKAKRVEIIACPGSAKTTTLALSATGSNQDRRDSSRSLVLSFSNASVAHVNETIRAFDKKSSAVVSTCHSYASRLINENLDILKIKKRPKICQSNELLQLLKAAIEDVRSDYKKQVRDTRSKSKKNRLASELKWLGEFKKSNSDAYRLMTLLGFASASRRKIRKIVCDSMFSWCMGHVNAIVAIRKRFDAKKKAQDLIGFGDMITPAMKILDSQQARTQSFDYLFVDEFQDCTLEQVLFIAKLAERIPYVRVFGDPLQAIYGFMGASYTALSSVLAGVKAYPLTRSFRLHQVQADIAMSVVKENGEKAKAMVGRAGGKKPVIVQCTSSSKERNAVIGRIRRLINNGTAPGKIAILGRIGAVLGPYTQLLRSEGVRTIVKGEHYDVKHPLCVLKLVLLVEKSKGAKLKIKHIRDALVGIKMDKKMLKNAMHELKQAASFRTLESRYKACAAVYLRLRGGVRSDRTVRNSVNCWEPMCKKYKSAAEMSDMLTIYSARESVDVLTIHGAKGRQWDYVFIVGATEGVIPHYGAISKRSWREELRVMYVAMTRCRKRTYVFHSPYADSRLRKTHTRLSTLLNHSKVLSMAVMKKD